MLNFCEKIAIFIYPLKKMKMTFIMEERKKS